jgi:hypothetical protein
VDLELNASLTGAGSLLGSHFSSQPTAGQVIDQQEEELDYEEVEEEEEQEQYEEYTGGGALTHRHLSASGAVIQKVDSVLPMDMADPQDKVAQWVAKGSLTPASPLMQLPDANARLRAEAQDVALRTAQLKTAELEIQLRAAQEQQQLKAAELQFKLRAALEQQRMRVAYVPEGPSLHPPQRPVLAPPVPAPLGPAPRAKRDRTPHEQEARKRARASLGMSTPAMQPAHALTGMSGAGCPASVIPRVVAPTPALVQEPALLPAPVAADPHDPDGVSSSLQAYAIDLSIYDLEAEHTSHTSKPPSLDSELMEALIAQCTTGQVSSDLRKLCAQRVLAQTTPSKKEKTVVDYGTKTL